jgi:hypothetical protein
MSDIHKSLRLGDLLVEKGLISRVQLRQAIEIQQALQSQRFGSKNINAKTELISRHQLQSNLNWQRRLKATTAMMVFIAPLLTAACGGGAGGSASASSNEKTEAASSQVLPEASPRPNPTSSSSSSLKPLSNSSSVPKTISSSSSKTSSTSSPKTISSSSKATSSASSVASSSASKSVVDGSVQLYWNVPAQRENGDYLDITEIGGYEVRYKLKSENTFKSIQIKDGFTDAYYFDYLEGDYEFQIATFDTDGLYSSFVSVNPS